MQKGEIAFTEENTEAVYRERIHYELSVIIRMGYAEYYLIVADFIRYAKVPRIPVGAGTRLRRRKPRRLSYRHH